MTTWAAALIGALVLGAVFLLARRIGQLSERDKTSTSSLERARRNAKIIARPAGSHADIANRMRQTNIGLSRSPGNTRQHYPET